MEMTVATSCRRAPTEAPMAMAAETPQTAPPAPRTAANRFSTPSARAAAKMTPKVATETMKACSNATGPAQAMRLSGSVAPNSTTPSLM